MLDSRDETRIQNLERAVHKCADGVALDNLKREVEALKQQIGVLKREIGNLRSQVSWNRGEKRDY